MNGWWRGWGLARGVWCAALLGVASVGAPPAGAQERDTCRAIPPDTGIAAQRADTLPLSLDDAVNRALAESEEIRVARATLAQAEGQVVQATAAYLPIVSGNLTYNRAIRTIFDDMAGPPPPDTTRIPEAFDETRTPQERYDLLSEFMTNDFLSALFQGLPFGRRNTYIATLQVAQPLFAGGRIAGARSLARHLRQAADERLAEAETGIVLDVRSAYLDALLAGRLHQIAVGSRAVAEEHFRQVEAFRRAGTASEFDLLRARVDLENRDPPVVQAANAANLALLGLKRLINIPAEQPVMLTTELEPLDVTLDEAMLADLILDRPLLRAAREAVEMSRAGVKIARASRWPTIAAVGNLGFQAYPNNLAPPGFAQWRKDWSVALSVSWTPFDGFRRNGQIAEAQAALHQAELEETQLREGLSVELAATLAAYHAARAQLRARRETVALAERAHHLAETRFASGLSTQLEVSDAALLLDQARLNEVQALYDHVKALAQLERLSGGRLDLLGGVGGGR
jgi:outer membrane protein TolC